MPIKTLSRRDLLKAAGITLAALGVTCSGTGYLMTRVSEVETPKYIFEKDNTMINRILVTYATRAGSTVDVAAAIGETLSGRDFNVDVKSVKDNPPLDNYKAVIIGSAVRMGSWLPEALNFVKSNQEALKKLPVALFSVHMANTADDETSRSNRLAYLKAIRPLLDPVDEAFFGGKMDFSRLSFLDRVICRLLKSQEEDRRQWDKIRGWGQTILA